MVHLKCPVSVKTSERTRVDLTVAVRRTSGGVSAVAAAEGPPRIHCA